MKFLLLLFSLASAHALEMDCVLLIKENGPEYLKLVSDFHDSFNFVYRAPEDIELKRTNLNLAEKILAANKVGYKYSENNEFLIILADKNANHPLNKLAVSMKKKMKIEIRYVPGKNPHYYLDTRTLKPISINIGPDALLAVSTRDQSLLHEISHADNFSKKKLLQSVSIKGDIGLKTVDTYKVLNLDELETYPYSLYLRLREFQKTVDNSSLLSNTPDFFDHLIRHQLKSIETYAQSYTEMLEGALKTSQDVIDHLDLFGMIQSVKMKDHIKVGIELNSGIELVTNIYTKKSLNEAQIADQVRKKFVRIKNLINGMTPLFHELIDDLEPLEQFIVREIVSEDTTMASSRMALDENIKKFNEINKKAKTSAEKVLSYVKEFNN